MQDSLFSDIDIDDILSSPKQVDDNAETNDDFFDSIEEKSFSSPQYSSNYQNLSCNEILFAHDFETNFQLEDLVFGANVPSSDHQNIQNPSVYVHQRNIIPELKNEKIPQIQPSASFVMVKQKEEAQEPKNDKKRKMDLFPKEEIVESPDILKKPKIEKQQQAMLNPNPRNINRFIFIFKDTKHLVDESLFGKELPNDPKKYEKIRNEDQFTSISQIHDAYSDINKKKLGYPLENVKENGIPFLKLNNLLEETNSKSFEFAIPFLQNRTFSQEQEKIKNKKSMKGFNGYSDLLSLTILERGKEKYKNKICLDKCTFTTMTFHYFEDREQFRKFLETKKRRIRNNNNNKKNVNNVKN